MLIAGSALARSDDRDQPMDIRADHSRMTQGSGKEGGVTVLTGNVKVTRGSMKASAAQATLYQHPDKAKDAKGNDVSNQVQRVVLTGKPARLQEISDDGDKVDSSAERIEYNADTSVAVLDGNVSVIREGRSEFRGQHMVYNTQTGAMESGNTDGSAPVHIVIQPKAKPAAKPAAAPAKSAADGGAG
ncbi:lipopolysaccharide transport periplasmic protein LptA [Dokdonella sp.]|uniref:lipopolysaccharide transport periplasmic protein LptA n=1 Tax=Dokdonella sp. TaxID=2291710 RepID=UPI0025B81052|nr:lipopolysaccharide transport periplasmic protein LptA [Dokdonella sp.]MBX3689963.1 lipopolysaccharide transport periplasmic protein LptA [Dokdonella sp.]